MFGDHSHSGSISTLTVLASVAIGALLAPLDFTTAQAQHPDMNLRRAIADLPLYQNAIVDDMAAGRAVANRKHATWVTDLESNNWPGFLTGMSGYEDFVMPVGMPMYFEDPFITSDLRLLYMRNQISSGSALGSG